MIKTYEKLPLVPFSTKIFIIFKLGIQAPEAAEFDDVLEIHWPESREKLYAWKIRTNLCSFIDSAWNYKRQMNLNV